MRVIADLHIHSRYSRACSQQLTLPNIAEWCDKKGIQVVGTGDFTHPQWFSEMREQLVESKQGLYKIRNTKSNAVFMCTAEVSSIYKQGEKVRRVHNIIFSPSIEAVANIRTALENRGVNIKSDGRPIMGIKCPELVKIVKDVDEACEIIPAHAWTPHFGIFGSLSGFNNLQEAFEDQAKYIFAIETGLSSDPAMNGMVSALDNISLISNSDPHSLPRLGREANVFEINENELSYAKIVSVIRENNPKEFLSTVEFFPEEGRYHYDGHRDCKFSCEPKRTKKLGGVCPVCRKQLLRGVLARVEDLADRAESNSRVKYKNLIQLEEIIADTYGVGVTSKRVKAKYDEILIKAKEFEILLDLSKDKLIEVVGKEIAESVVRTREGKVHIEPGYDGEYGKIEIYTPEERDKLLARPKQMGLF